MQSGSFRSSVFSGFYVSFTQVDIEHFHSDSSNKKKEGRTTSNLLPKSNPRVGSKAKKTSATECLIITRPSYRKRVDITLLLFLWVTLYQWHKSDPTPSLSRRHSAISPTVLSQACDISRVKYGRGNFGLGTLFKKIRSSEKHLCECFAHFVQSCLYFLSTHRGPDKHTAIRRNDAHSERQHKQKLNKRILPERTAV